MNKSTNILILSIFPFLPVSVSAEVKEANAIIKPTFENKAGGNLNFKLSGSEVVVSGTIENLTPGAHGMHLHEVGDCSAPKAESAGAHFNPTNAEHGDLQGHSHSGDLGNIIADDKGKAVIHIKTDKLKLNGAQSIVGKSVIVHAKADDLKTQPSGNSGDRIACGVIQ